MANPDVKGFHHTSTGTCVYVVSDPGTKKCAVIDSVADFDAQSGNYSFQHAKEVGEYIKAEGMEVEWAIETHAHADHLSGAPYFKREFKAKTAIGARISEVQEVFSGIYGLEGFPTDGSQWDKLLKEGEPFQIGSLEVGVMHTPGHTPACSTYLVGDCAFTGDTLFFDIGSARCDFPKGSAEEMWNSITRITSLPPNTRIHVGHDYPKERLPKFSCTVSEMKEVNPHLVDCEGNPSTKEKFVEQRQKRDAGLKVPALLYPSIQANIRGGELPEQDKEGRTFLKLPVTVAA